jgi:plasmid stabilization system protein ParE
VQNDAHVVVAIGEVRLAGDEATEQAPRFLELVATETEQAQATKRAGVVRVPPEHGAIKLLRRRRVSLALKQLGLIERRIAGGRLRRHGSFGGVHIGAPENRVVRSASFNRNCASQP